MGRKASPGTRDGSTGGRIGTVAVAGAGRAPGFTGSCNSCNASGTLFGISSSGLFLRNIPSPR
jgi:hypothetical protein